MIGSAASKLAPRPEAAAHGGQARGSVRHCLSRTGIHASHRGTVLQPASPEASSTES